MKKFGRNRYPGGTEKLLQGVRRVLENKLKGMADILEHCWVANIIVFSSQRVVFWSKKFIQKTKLFCRVHWLFPVKASLKWTISSGKPALRIKILFTCKIRFESVLYILKSSLGEHWVVYKLVEFQGSSSTSSLSCSCEKMKWGHFFDVYFKIRNPFFRL